MSFKNLTDHQEIAGQLRRSLESGRLAHAYLFAGPRGTGRAEMAKTLAKAVNCTTAEADACDRCDSCTRIEQMIHPDIYWLRPESKSRRISIEKIREFEQSVQLRPTSARIKVGILVDADCLGEAASNAFLKTLEEPPDHTIIILLTTEPQRLLPTILSRCLKINFGVTGTAPSPYRDQLVPLLAGLSVPKARGVATAYRLLAELTALLQSVRAEITQQVEAESDLDRYSELDAEVRERLEDQQAARLEGEYRAARERVLEEIYTWFADVLLCVAGAEPQWLAHADMAEAIRAAAGGVTYQRAVANLDAIEGIRESLARNITESLALEVGMLKLVGVREGVPA